MLNFNGAISTCRYWQNIKAIQAENTPSIDRASKLAELRTINSATDGLLKALDRDGIVVIPDYWTANECAVGRAEIDRLIIEHPEVCRIFSGGADKRMFGVEMVSEPLTRFHSDPFMRGLGEVHGGMQLYNFATLGARIDATGTNNGSGDGWHRDAFGFQYKSMLYLSDVSDDNGPFEFLPGSHKLWRVATDTALGNLPAAPQSRFEVSAIDRLIRRTLVPRKRCTGRAGTLVLFNSSGLHRGAPLRKGERYAVTNYFYNPYQLGNSLIEKFEPMMPGVADRVRADLAGTAPARAHA